GKENLWLVGCRENIFTLCSSLSRCALSETRIMSEVAVQKKSFILRFGLDLCVFVQCGNQTRVLQHYWYTSWPDHKTPDSAMPLLQLMADVEADRRAAATTGPVIVHCSAGIGRTGCFIATTIGCRQLQVEGVVDVLSITCQLRADRGGMIQTGEQYEFVHHALSLYEARVSAETGQ
uniref:protein-tyrosine-phosphatase n=1 Tax=Mastacembelus armatus TaxID=205130 RepID=A0A7N8XJK1_9TELE